MLYFDYNSTTPVDPAVLEAMLPYFNTRFGNASSNTHAMGWGAAEAVTVARERVAGLINCSPEEIVFTSGSTEAINLAIKGVAEAYSSKGRHIVTTQTEHNAVLDTCRYLEKKGFEVEYLPVMSDGLIDLAVLEKSIRPDTILVAVMMVNNETGIIQPVTEIGRIVKEKNSIFFTDATQAAGKMHIDVEDIHAGLLCLSAHKFYGPKGTGSLFIRRKNPRVAVVPQLHGGGHEKNRRSGTLNVPGIVGMGAAAQLCVRSFWDEAGRISLMRTRIEHALTEDGNVSVNGNIKSRISNTTNLCFHGMRSDQIISQLPEVALATGSACSSAVPDPSHVLIAMGLDEKDAFSSLRFSLGRFTTEEEVERVIEKFQKLKML